MFSVFTGTNLSCIFIFFASYDDTWRIASRWKNAETVLVDNKFSLPILFIALLCGAIVGAFVTYRLRKKESLQALAQALDDTLSAAMGLTVPSSKSTSAPSQQKKIEQQHYTSFIKPETPGKLKRFLSRIGGLRSWKKSNQTEETNVETLLLKVKALQSIIDQNLKEPGIESAPRINESNESRAATVKPLGSTRRGNMPLQDKGCETELPRNNNTNKIIEHQAQPPPSAMNIDGTQPTIVRRKDTEAAPNPGNIADVLVQLYNRAVDDRGLRSDFRGRFQLLRIGTVNATERRRDPNLIAEFRESSDGNFFAVKIEGQSKYLVILGFDVAVKHTSFEAGAIGEVFNCPGYDADLSYLFVKLHKPAVFQVNGENWELHQKGELDLGPGE